MTGVAVKVTLVFEQIVEPGLAPTVTEGVNTGFTAMVIGVEVAVSVERQGSVEVITTVTISPFSKPAVVKVELVSPGTATPLVFH